MVMVAKPKGTAGTTYSIQVEMGLAGSKKKNDQYKAIQVDAHIIEVQLSLTQ